MEVVGSQRKGFLVLVNGFEISFPEIERRTDVGAWSVGESSWMLNSGGLLAEDIGEVVRFAFLLDPRLGVPTVMSEFARDFRFAMSALDAGRNAGSSSDNDKSLFLLPGRLSSILARKESCV